MGVSLDGATVYLITLAGGDFRLFSCPWPGFGPWTQVGAWAGQDAGSVADTPAGVLTSMGDHDDGTISVRTLSGSVVWTAPFPSPGTFAGCICYQPADGWVYAFAAAPFGGGPYPPLPSGFRLGLWRFRPDGSDPSFLTALGFNPSAGSTDRCLYATADGHVWIGNRFAWREDEGLTTFAVLAGDSTALTVDPDATDAVLATAAVPSSVYTDTIRYAYPDAVAGSAPVYPTELDGQDVVGSGVDGSWSRGVVRTQDFTVGGSVYRWYTWERSRGGWVIGMIPIGDQTGRYHAQSAS